MFKTQAVAVIAVLQSESNAQPRLFSVLFNFLSRHGPRRARTKKMLRGEARAGGMLEAGKR